MYKEGSKLWFISQIIESMNVGATVNIIFENDYSFCYVLSSAGGSVAKHTIPQWYSTNMQVTRNYIKKICDETGAIIRTKGASPESRMLHLWRIK